MSDLEQRQAAMEAFGACVNGFGGCVGASTVPLSTWNRWDTRDWPNGRRGHGYTVTGSYGLTWAIVPAGGKRWNLNATNKQGFRKTWGPFKNPTAAAEAKRRMLAGGMAEKIRDAGRYTDPRGFGRLPKIRHLSGLGGCDDLGGKGGYYFFSLGTRAWNNMQPLHANPYQRGSWQSKWWIEGWDDARIRQAPAFGGEPMAILFLLVAGGVMWAVASTGEKYAVGPAPEGVPEGTKLPPAAKARYADAFGRNDDERDQWVENDEGLYNHWLRWQGNQRSWGRPANKRLYLRTFREEIDQAIDRVLNRPPASGYGY